jgi:hypothetical protein
MSNPNGNNVKLVEKNNCPPEKSSVSGKLSDLLSSVFKWIAKGSAKEPFCR